MVALKKAGYDVMCDTTSIYNGFKKGASISCDYNVVLSDILGIKKSKKKKENKENKEHKGRVSRSLTPQNSRY